MEVIYVMMPVCASPAYDASGAVNLVTAGWKYCKKLQCGDGYSYKCAIPLGN